MVYEYFKNTKLLAGMGEPLIQNDKNSKLVGVQVKIT